MGASAFMVLLAGMGRGRIQKGAGGEAQDNPGGVSKTVSCALLASFCNAHYFLA